MKTTGLVQQVCAYKPVLLASDSETVIPDLESDLYL